ncbi:MAG: ATP-binding protein [Deltaproteobacteria bacterium]
MASTPEELAGTTASSSVTAPVEHWYEGLIESSPTGIGLMSALENRYVMANPALLELYGMSLEELLSIDPFTMALRVTHPDDLVAEQKLFAELAVGARRSYRIEKRFMRPDGSFRWGLASLSGGFAPSIDPAAAVGPLLWLTIQVIDTTEQRALAETLERREGEFRHAQKVDALGRLAAGIAHDFNNLLTVITGHGEVLKEAIQQPDAPASLRELADDLGAILAASERAAALTAQLLTHGRRERVVPRPFVLSELAATFQRLLQRTIGSNVEVEAALEATGSIFADQGQVGQVVMNLMLNARDALSDGGRIRLETRDLRIREEPLPEQGTVGTMPGPGEWVALIVTDSGHGMSAEVQARMFEPFFTTRAERVGVQGNGLGLATVQRIVLEAGGHIAVQSAPGKGTAVSVFFPRVQPGPVLAASELPPPPPHVLPNSRRILVIEDDPSVRALVGTVLLGAHYLVVVARDGAEGMRKLESAEKPFHLVITDLMMPQIGGASLAQQLHGRGGQPKILFISGYSTHTPTELLPYGHFLPKPFTPAQLLGAVVVALGEPA